MGCKECSWLYWKCVRSVLIKVTHENIFRVKDKDIPEITEEQLKGLSIWMKEYDRVSLYGCFKDCKKLERIVFPEDFSMDNVISFSCMFENCEVLKSIKFPDYINTNNVDNMRSTFEGCKSLNILKFPQCFNTSRVKYMSRLFYECKSLISLDLSTFNTANVTTILTY